MLLGIAIHLSLITTACASNVCSMQAVGECRNEKLSSVEVSMMSVSLFQSEVSSFRVERRHKHRQGDLPDLLKQAAGVTSTPLPDISGSSSTLPPLPLTAIPIIRHAKPPNKLANEISNYAGLGSEHVDNMKGSKHSSVFKLRFDELDIGVFWFILVCMLLFTIVVDRLEFVIAAKTGHNMARQMYLNRLNAELLMFGVVSSVVLISEQFYQPSVATEVIFEFVGIFCSVGAFGLFISGMVLLIMHHWMERRWKFFGGRQQGSHLREDQRMQFERAAANSLLQDALSATSLRRVDVQHCEYCIMSARFKRSHALPEAFDYSEYLKLCLTSSICDLISINWISWVVVFVFALCLYEFHVLYGQYTQHVYVIIFAVGVWFLAIVHITALVVVLQAKMYLRQGLGCNVLSSLQESLREAVQTPSLLSVHPVQRLNNRLVSVLEQTIQFIGLATSFQGAFLVMHVLYNVQHWGWRVSLVAPMVIDAVVLLPLITSNFTVIKAYYSPDYAIVDSTLEWSSKVEEDVRFVAKQLRMNEPIEKYRNALQSTSKEAFLQSMIDMGFHISPQRAHRVYAAFSDEKGMLDQNTFVDALLDSKHAQSLEQNHALSPKHGSLIQDSLVGRTASAMTTALVGRSAWGGPTAPPSPPATSSIQGLDSGLRGLAMPSTPYSTNAPAPQYNVIY